MTKSKGNGNSTGCPIINSLMNMEYLDSKKEWSTQNVQNALKKIKMSDSASFLLVNGASKLLKFNDLPFTAKSLQKHNIIEHDASMSREDYNLGDHIHFNKQRFNLINKYFPKQKYITLKELTEYMHHLHHKSIKENANVNFGVKQYFTIGGETCLIFILLSEDDKLSLKKLRHVFEKETLDNIKINSIGVPNLVSSYIKFNLYWANASLRKNE